MKMSKSLKLNNKVDKDFIVGRIKVFLDNEQCFNF